MNTCKDCLYYEVCQYHIDEETNMTVEECSFEFKHVEQYVKLPAYIGQEVWVLFTPLLREVEILKGKVSMLQQKADKSWKIRVSRNGSVYDYTLDDFGVTVFLSETAAEEKRKGLGD